MDECREGDAGDWCWLGEWALCGQYTKRHEQGVFWTLLRGEWCTRFVVLPLQSLTLMSLCVGFPSWSAIRRLCNRVPGRGHDHFDVRNHSPSSTLNPLTAENLTVGTVH